MPFLSPQGVKQEIFGPRQSTADVGMTEAEKKAAQRAKARALGLCSICRRNKPAKGYVTCADCIEAAKLRVQRNRAKAKKRRKKH